MPRKKMAMAERHLATLRKAGESWASAAWLERADVLVSPNDTRQPYSERTT